MINGFYNVLKPSGFTSSDVVIKLRGILRANYGVKVKVGHLGTLDPGGSGVLPVAVGVATHLFDDLGESKKVYRAQAVLGLTTDTLDSYGTVINKIPDDITIDAQKVTSVFSSFIGKQLQTPPAYSAKNIDGKRAYELARAGKSFDLEQAEIEIFDVKLLDIDANKITFDLTCSSGTYVRAFVRDFAAKLGYPAYMSYIIRTYAAGFSIADSVPLEEIERDVNSGFVSLEEFAEKLPRKELKEEERKAYGYGTDIFCESKGIQGIYADEKFLGVGKSDNGTLKKVSVPIFDVIKVDNFDKRLFPQKISLALGYFDAIHLGHKDIIKETVASNGIPAVFTLKGNINKYSKNESADIFSFENRKNAFYSYGVKKIFYQEITEDFMSLTPTEFLDMLTEKINVGTFVCGADYTFGAKASGNARLLKEYCDKKNIILKVVDIKNIDGVKVSSSGIKKALREGDMPYTNKCLGYSYYIRAKVESGRKEGRKLGFPTLNMKIDPTYVTPKAGVYHTCCYIKGKRYESVTNVGDHPTYSDNNFNAETHVIDYDGNLYGKIVKIEFIKFIRDIKKFSSFDELKKQIEQDIKEVKNE